ncbi:MAG: cytidine deaminase [Gemmatimonadales bacterium]|nr:MAG: cytidine deaminase [Gemmatimonadales bacterium]
MDALIRRAWSVRAHAHAPYSRFRVGAALETEDGSIFVGVNVENASFGLTVCAERNAVAAAVAAGHRRFTRIAIATEAELATPPCGACRQVLAEFAPELEVYSEVPDQRSMWHLDELLPARFAADGLPVPSTADAPSGEGTSSPVTPEPTPGYDAKTTTHGSTIKG